jgi:hypothetical protein
MELAAAIFRIVFAVYATLPARAKQKRSKVNIVLPVRGVGMTGADR